MGRLEYNKNTHAAKILAAQYNHKPYAYVRSFGCQQSVNDGERIKGVLIDVGYTITNSPQEADVILFNACAVREHAEQRVYGNIGALKSLKMARPGVLIGLCGCMAAQKVTVDKLKESYPFVDMVIGVNAADALPDILVEKLTTRKKALRVPIQREEIVEDVPTIRDSKLKALLPIMFGCDNYCSYCIVPYVRGSERSRKPDDVQREFEELVQQGYKEITLLGQNVNSYGKGLEEKVDFSELLTNLSQVPGEFKIRFMTSHPRDATRKLVDTIIASDKICKHLHLPVQSGSNEILARMNRKYTVEDYLALIRYAKSICPEMTFSSDIMVGFPGETEEDFQKSIDLVKEVGYTQLFTFIYSKRVGTEAASLPDDMTHQEKTERIDQLIKLQEEMAQKVASPWIGQQFTGLVEGPARDETMMVARLDNNMLVEFEGEESCVGSFRDFEITGLKGAILRGNLV